MSGGGDKCQAKKKAVMQLSVLLPHDKKVVVSIPGSPATILCGFCMFALAAFP